MITRIELEHFKGIRDRVTLDLKPITLLFGANSSGKSTVVHALHYALEVLKHQNLDPDRTTLGGDSVDLGGFRSLVHGHDENGRIQMLFEFGVDGSLPDYTEDVASTTAYRGAQPPLFDHSRLDDSIDTAWVRVEIGWSRALGAPQVFRYAVGANGDTDRPILEIEMGGSKGQTSSAVFRANHAVFGEPVLEVSSREAGALYFAEENGVMRLLSEADIASKDGVALFTLYGQRSAVPTWGRALRLRFDDAPPEGSPAHAEVERIVSRCGVGLGELLVRELERLLYVGPLRAVPPRSYRPPLTEDAARWADGLGAWDALHRRGEALVSRASTWMQRLDTGYRLELRTAVELDAATAGSLELLVEDLLWSGGAIDAPTPRGRRSAKTPQLGFGLAEARAELWRRGYQALQGAAKRDELLLVDERNRITLRPSDVGVGISQVLPVIVAALYRGERGAGAFVVVEQPELHIHPKLQVALADLFIEQSSAGSLSDHVFLLETHSEHMMLRLLRRMRETHAEGTKAPTPMETRPDTVTGVARADSDTANAVEDDGPKLTLTPDHVSIIYVQRGEDGSTKFVPLRIDERGEFLDVWPDGFFEERDPELFG